jgi:hypothetical protein
MKHGRTVTVKNSISNEHMHRRRIARNEQMHRRCIGVKE